MDSHKGDTINPKDYCEEIEERFLCSLDLYRNSGESTERSKALEELVFMHEGLIKAAIDNKFYGFKAKHYDELYNSGIIGLIRSFEPGGFDPKKGKRFSTYAVRWIHHEIVRTIQCEISNSTPHYSHSRKVVRNAIARLNEMGIEHPTIDDISSITSLGQTAIKSTLVADSMHNAAAYDCEMLEYLAMDKNPNEIIEEKEKLVLLKRAISKLDMLQQEVLAGWLDVEQKKCTERQLSSRLGITVSQIHKIRAAAMKALREDPQLSGVCDYDPGDYEKELDEFMVTFVLPHEVLTDELNHMEKIEL